MDNTFYPSEEVFEPKRESFSMPRSVQNDRHEVADKSAQMSPTPEVDNKNRNTRRRNTLAVSTIDTTLTVLTDSASDAENERSDAVTTMATGRGVQTVEPREMPPTANT